MNTTHFNIELSLNQRDELEIRVQSEGALLFFPKIRNDTQILFPNYYDDEIIFSHTTPDISFPEILKIITYLRFLSSFKNIGFFHHTSIRILINEFPNFNIPPSFHYHSHPHYNGTILIVFEIIPPVDNPRDAVDYFPELFAT